TPLVYGFARKRGLQEADAADLTQEVLRAVAGSVQRLDYDPSRGTFRAWLYTVSCSKFTDYLRGRNGACAGSGNSAIHAMLCAQPAPDEAQWEEEYQRQLFAAASARVRHEFKETTWQAFWRVAVEDHAAKDVAEALALTVGAVYIAKSRVLRRLKEEI